MQRPEKCLGRVAKVAVNAPSVGPNRRATRRRLREREDFVDSPIELAKRAWRQLLYCHNKLVAARRSPRASVRWVIEPAAELAHWAN